MAAKKTKTAGDILADQLFEALGDFVHVPVEGARDLAVLSGLTDKGIFLSPPENLLSNALTHLVDSQRVFVVGDKIMQEVDRGDVLHLMPLATRDRVEGSAPAVLANLIVAGTEESWFLLPRSFVQLLLLSDRTWRETPRVDFYFHRPVFDANWILRGPGWHPQQKLLIHGADVEPLGLDPDANGCRGLDRFPHLGRLLKEFPFRTKSDRTNFIGALLTGVLVNHFIRGGKPIILLLGNQSSLGKTLLAGLLGVILDGLEPPMLTLSRNDDEFQKRLSAKIRSRLHTVILIDNVKRDTGDVISSETLESLTTQSEISLRELGFSKDIKCPNHFVWVVTANNPKTGRDISSRMVPVELYLEEAPEGRKFAIVNPLRYAEDHRPEILAELYSMVAAWRQQGGPEGETRLRFHPWDHVIAGILAANGFEGFLENLHRVAAAVDSGMDDIAAIAERVLDRPDGPFEASSDESRLKARSRPARQWVEYAKAAGNPAVGVAKSRQGASSALGRFLSGFIGRTIDIMTANGATRVRLRKISGRAREQDYVFEVLADGEPADHDPDPVPDDQAGTSDAEKGAPAPATVPTDDGQLKETPAAPSEGNCVEW